MFDKHYNMLGTQIMIEGKTLIQMENFSQKDYQFRNGICSTGYKKYYTTEKGNLKVDASQDSALGGVD